jgi:2-polyprenyl-3-methyl-5-hydroxy-6-metoxy-1,4-benzoquinol methylase
MDELIKRFDCIEWDDLSIVPSRGIAYQRDMTTPVEYGEDYFNMCLDYEDKEIALKINKGRCEFVREHTGREVLDIGIGSGEFIKKFGNAVGFDVNEVAVKWLKKNNKYCSDIESKQAFTFWDVLEHIDNPARHYFKHMTKGSYVFVSMPIFEDLRNVKKSKHYRPNEHLYYFTEKGFIDYMGLYGFRCLAVDDFETTSGRESISSFAFIKEGKTFNDNVGQYKEIYSSTYGNSSFVYFDYVYELVKKTNAMSILDYGSGMSDLVTHFWMDGKRRIERFDPAIPRFKTVPHGVFDLILCMDVLEHVDMKDVGRVLDEIKSKSKSNKVMFIISTELAQSILPDGRNAHITILNANEWARWIESVFGVAKIIKNEFDTVVTIATF